MSWVVSELRQTIRSLSRRPGFTAVVVLTLGLGLGVNTAIFSAVHRLILAPMPFQDGDRLAFVWRESADNGMLVTPAPEVAYAWLEAGGAIEGVGLWRHAQMTLLDAGEPLRFGVPAISPELPALVHVRPLVGRTFTASEARERAPVVLISEGLWRSRFGGRRDVIDEAVRLDSVLYTVVGVMPDRFAGFDGRDGDDEAWVPLAREDLIGMNGHVGALVKVREGATLAQASEELDRLARAASPVAESEEVSWRYRAVPPGEFLGSGTRTGLMVLLGAVTLVLLIACANIAALLLVRLSGRRRDLAVRTAIGAPRSRLLASLSLELAALAVAGGVVGLVLASWSVDAIRALRPPQVDGLAALDLSGAVLLYAAGLAVLTALLFGLAPGISLLRRDLGSPLRAAMGAGDRVSDGSRTRATIVVGQVALSVTLLVGAALLVRTVGNLRSADVGFQPEGLPTVDFQLPKDRYAGPEAIAAFVREMGDALRGLPGVAGVTDAMGVPPDIGVTFGTLQIEGEAEEGAGDGRPGTIPATFVGPGTFTLLGAPLVEGREFTEADVGAEVAVVDEAFAARHWPGRSAVGGRFRLSRDGDWTTVVGVAPTMAVNGPAARRRGAIFYATGRNWERQSFLVRGATADAASLAPAVREAVKRVDPLLAIEEIRTVEQALARSIATQRFLMVLLTTFATLALLLSAIGLYGLLAFALQRRTREIGIRLALGAAPTAVRNLLLRQGAILALIGTGLGLVAALAGARALESLLHGVQPRDPISFASAAAVIAGTAILASWLPARRATRVDPMETLRTE